MKTLLAAFFTLTLISTTSQAADPFPEQPAMSAAIKQLAAANKSLEAARQNKPGKHLQEAIFHLDNANKAIELGAKNKGTYGPTARKLISQAKEALQAAPSDRKRADEAEELIKKAAEQIIKAARAGNR